MIKTLHKPLKSQALLRTGIGGSKVVLEGAVFVFPRMHHLETLDLTIKTFTLRQAVLCKDQTTVMMEALFYLSIDCSPSSIQLAARKIGSERSFNQEALKEIFEPKFIVALRNVAATMDRSTLQIKSPALKLEIMKAVGVDLNGYVLEDCIVNTIDVLPTL
ncbi:MAG: SPFH domain-containing protein [Aureispira sp.]